MKSQARILIFTGDGKGKTTAALGMVLRASGHGMRAIVIQFMKQDASTGEVAALKRHRNVRLVQTGLGFVPRPAHPQFGRHQAAARRGLQFAERALPSRRYDLIVLDEICTALKFKLIEEERILRLLKKARGSTRVVLTGRGATRRLVARADTVTEMRCVKHGFRQGIRAREGVEF